MRIHLQTEYPESTTDGAGIRYSIYVQGCRGGLHGNEIVNCPGCHNPETWSFDKQAAGSYFLEAAEIIEKMKQSKFSWGRLTLCGGDPIWQVPALLELIAKLKEQKHDFNIWAYSGLTYEHIRDHADAQNQWREYLEQLDVLVDGPFLLHQRDITLPWRGSPNQRVIDVKKTLITDQISLWDSK